jgi:hypothetical protein
VFPGVDRLLQDLGVDLLGEPVVGPGVAMVGLGALAMTELLGQRE